MKYILKTTYPCLVKNKDSFTEMEINDTLEIEDETIIFIYPENSKQIPFYINLATKKESEFYSFIKRENINFILLEAPKSMEITEKHILELSTILKEYELAYTNFQSMSPSVKKTYAKAYFDARTEDGRKKRIAWMVDRLSKNLKPM